MPLYRQYNPFAQTGTHNYTAAKAENDHLVSLGWREEGNAWYGINFSGTGGSTDVPDKPSATLCDVTFVAGEGATIVPDVTVEAGSTCPRPTTPTRGNDVFEGWYTDFSCTVPF